MRVGIDALWLLPGMTGGAETYVRGLTAALGPAAPDDEFVLFTNRENHDSFRGLPGNFRRALFNHSARWTLAGLTMTRAYGQQLYLPCRALQERLDVLHCPLDIAALGARCPVVLTIHDLNFGAVHETTLSAAQKLGEALVRGSARRADAVLTVSRFSRGQICERLGVPARKVRVVYNAPAARPCPPPGRFERLRARWRLWQPYYLGFSSLNAHKNIETLIAAFARLPSRARRRLVVAGHLPKGGADLPGLARRLGVAERAVFTGYVDDADAAALLSRAVALAFPSLYEGFGLPVVEAMAAGVPVACSTAASLPEIAGDAALFFSPRDAGTLAGLLERLFDDEELRRRLSEAGRRNAARFSWRRCAAQTADAYRRAAQGLPAALEPAGEAALR